jgi:hypothetical protein
MENENMFIDIIGYEGYYKINKKGEILNIKPTRAGRYSGLMKTWSDGRYINIALVRENKRKIFLLHRLLAIHFIPNPENKPTVDHVDQNKLNNDLSNLRWASHLEQHQNMSTTLHFETADERRIYENKRKNEWRIKKNLYLKAVKELMNIDI